VNIEGKVALVTGGSRGIGRETVKALAAKGARVLFTYRSGKSEADDLLQELGGGSFASAYECNVAEAARIDELVRAIRSQGLSPDILVNNAGTSMNGSLEDATPERWQQAFDLHVKAPALLARAFSCEMKKKKGGVIVNIGSVAGVRGVPGIIIYATVKGAVVELTRALARELAAFNVRAVCVSPGIIRTDFHKAMTAEQKRLNEETRIPLHREGKPEEVARLIVSLVENDYITGENVMIDGGLTMRLA